MVTRALAARIGRRRRIKTSTRRARRDAAEAIISSVPVSEAVMSRSPGHVPRTKRRPARRRMIAGRHPVFDSGRNRCDLRRLTPSRRRGRPVPVPIVSDNFRSRRKAMQSAISRPNAVGRFEKIPAGLAAGSGLNDRGLWPQRCTCSSLKKTSTEKFSVAIPGSAPGVEGSGSPSWLRRIRSESIPCSTRYFMVEMQRACESSQVS